MKQRLDLLLVARGLAATREKAQGAIMAGEVFVDGRRVDKAGMQVADGAELEVRGGMPYVSRGGYKLAEALDRFHIDVAARVCVDVGASTGGFTDVLLQRGAAKVYAIDVGYGQLDWTLRSNTRVVVMERTNIRAIRTLPEPVTFACIDVSFISLQLVLPVVKNLLSTPGAPGTPLAQPQPEGGAPSPSADFAEGIVLRTAVGTAGSRVPTVVALIKPQFEAGKGQVGKGGVIRDPIIHRAVLETALQYCANNDWNVKGLTVSPIKGPAGNVEFLVHLVPGYHSAAGTRSSVELVDHALIAAADLR
jgi:23S rRNA (cytidine1920-2'-O)/16S rRNA (cytidine1409-2'-O)-methyltransferase